MSESGGYLFILVCILNLQSDATAVTDAHPQLSSCCQLLELIFRKGLQRECELMPRSVDTDGSIVWTDIWLTPRLTDTDRGVHSLRRLLIHTD